MSDTIDIQKIFTKLDLDLEYNNIYINESDKWKGFTNLL